MGGVAEVVADDHAARDVLNRLLDEYQPRSALCWRHPVLAGQRHRDLVELDVAELDALRARVGDDPAVWLPIFMGRAEA